MRDAASKSPSKRKSNARRSNRLVPRDARQAAAEGLYRTNDLA